MCVFSPRFDARAPTNLICLRINRLTQEEKKKANPYLFYISNHGQTQGGMFGDSSGTELRNSFCGIALLSQLVPPPPRQLSAKLGAPRSFPFQRQKCHPVTCTNSSRNSTTLSWTPKNGRRSQTNWLRKSRSWSRRTSTRITRSRP